MNLTLALVATGLAALGLLVWALIERGRAARAEVELRLVREQAEANREILTGLSAQTANQVAESLVARATETFQAQERMNQARLEAQLKPVAETLEKFGAQVTALEVQRAAETGGLKEQIAALALATAATQDEARKLSSALRRGAGVQGRWGEQMLRNVLEMAGLRHKVDFEEQVSTNDADSLRRPDVTVRLPGGGVFVIDAKCSLNAFLEAQDAPDDALREAGYARHAQSVRNHVKSLSDKAYWDAFDRSPDFVAMFIPGDAFLAAATDRLPDLMTEAMDKRVILVTPSTLFALCKAVSYGWRVEQQALNAREVADLGKELYKRISVMGGHAAAMGRGLQAAVGKYNDFVASLERNVLTQARRFEDLKVDHEGREMPELAPIEAAVAPLAKLQVVESDDPPGLTG